MRLVVAGSTTVEVPVLLVQHERIHAPVLTLRFDDVGVREQENGALAPGASVANDQVRLVRISASHEDVAVGEAGGPEAPRRGLGNGRRRASRVARLDLDHLLVNRARELAVLLGRHGARRRRLLRARDWCEQNAGDER